jgi:TFIIS helical bundle-like domain
METPAKKLKTDERVLTITRLQGDPSQLPSFVAAGGVLKLADWLSTTESSSPADLGLRLGILSVLEKIPMTIDLLKESKIGKVVNEVMKSTENPVVGNKGRIILNQWKALVSGNTNIQGPKQNIPLQNNPSMIQASISHGVEEEEKLTVHPEPLPLSETNALFNALAALAEEVPRRSKRRKALKWEEDSYLVRIKKFDVENPPNEISATDIEFAGNLGEHESVGSFKEIRMRERKSGAKSLLAHQETDLDDEIEAIVDFSLPYRITLSEEVKYSIKNLMSYEKQDLADVHGGRVETFYSEAVPSNPNDPSTNLFSLQASQNVVSTKLIYLRGVSVKEPDIEEVDQVESASFAEEFVKLPSTIQKLIMENDNLLKLFRSNAHLMKNLSEENLFSITMKQQQPQERVVTIPMVPEKAHMSAASIVSSLKTRSNFTRSRGSKIDRKHH